MKKLGRIKSTYLVIFLAVGISLVLLSNFGKEREETVNETEVKSVFENQDTEKKLKEIIEGVDGISDVSVFISYDNKGMLNIASEGDESTVSDGEKKTTSKRIQAVTKRDSSGEAPFVTEELLPRVRGVIVTARGVSDEAKNALITRAVSTALDVPLHRVRVLPKD